jgi:hypothetical protein
MGAHGGQVADPLIEAYVRAQDRFQHLADEQIATVQ